MPLYRLGSLIHSLKFITKHCVLLFELTCLFYLFSQPTSSKINVWKMQNAQKTTSLFRSWKRAKRSNESKGQGCYHIRAHKALLSDGHPWQCLR